jgi:hypothetical protein
VEVSREMIDAVPDIPTPDPKLIPQRQNRVWRDEQDKIGTAAERRT